MEKFFRASILLLVMVFSSFSLHAAGMSHQEIVDYYSKVMNEPGNITFTPPDGWQYIDPSVFQSHRYTKVLLMGKGSPEYPPTITLGVEPLKGSIKDWLLEAKAISDASHDVWKDLGMITTQAGKAQLVQVDKKEKWGEARQMFALIAKDEMLYVLVVSSRRDEFSKFYKDFFATIQSMRFNENGI